MIRTMPRSTGPQAETPVPDTPPSLAARAEQWGQRVRELLDTLRAWPWYDTLRTLAERFREDRLGLTAGSLTFTTLLALVPLATVMLALFSAFPMFASLQGALENWFLQSLVPGAIAQPVLESLTQFATRARGLGTIGLLVLVATALALLLTIDHTLNAIWRVRQPRPIAQRILVYWAALTLGPLLLGLSLSLTSNALTSSQGMASVLPGGLVLSLGLLEFVLFAMGAAGLFHYVPNTRVRWRHAMAGGLFVALGIEVAKRGLAWYLASVPTYSVMYGAFATVPILLLWIYTLWVIVLWGAVIAAYSPSLQMRVVRRAATPGHLFELALAVLRELAALRGSGAQGLSLGALAEKLRADPLQLEPVLHELQSMDWVAPLEEPGDGRWVLLADPAGTPIAALADRLLLTPGPAAAALRDAAALHRVTLAEVLRGG
jgi:membrane protein